MIRASIRRAAPVLALTIALPVAVLVGCNDSNVPFFTEPTGSPTTPGGFQNLFSGLVSASRTDFPGPALTMNGFGRQAANFTNTEPRFVTNLTGFNAISPSGFAGTWALEYTDIAQANTMQLAIAGIKPAYTAAQAAALAGMVQTIKAMNYMLIADDHDTLGAAILPANQTGTTPPPALCNKDVWKYIVLLLDSANANLNTAGGIAPPVRLPGGFDAVGQVAGPSTVAGSFASFNRALAARAGLALAYAIARGPGGSPADATHPGSPDAAALTRADSAMLASALYAPGALSPNPNGGWTADAHSVFFDFSSTSGDETNPFNGDIGTLVVLKEVPEGQDTINDLRWQSKFMPYTATIQQSTYAVIATPWTTSMYQSPGSLQPILRNEGLVLTRAQIQIGLGNYPAAYNLINTVRTQVGGAGLAPASAGYNLYRQDTVKAHITAHHTVDTVAVAAVNPSSYTSVRDFLLREQQISTLLETFGERAPAIRMYGLAAQLDTTWGPGDLHTTVDPIPFAELSARGGTFTTTCP